MYKPGKGYWINVSTDSLTSEERSKVREYLDFPDNIANYKYVYFYFQEDQDVLHINTSDKLYLDQDVFLEPKEFMYLLKLYSINIGLALSACVETVKRKFEEEFGGLG